MQRLSVLGSPSRGGCNAEAVAAAHANTSTGYYTVVERTSQSFSQTRIPFDLFSDMSDSENVKPPTTVDSGEELDVQEYSEEEIEVTDDEGSADEETAKKPIQSPPVDSSSKGKGSAKGKVQPTEAVKNAPMESPESVSKKGMIKFSPDKNPFPSNGVWNKDTLSQIKIAFPILTGKNETTNDLTRSTRPESRFWKAPIVFKYSNFTSETLRFDNVHIPFHTGKGYGDNFVYLMLPSEAGEAFSSSGKEVSPTKVVENSLMPDKARWWKIANKVEGLFGTISPATKRFQSKSLSTIFDATQSGMSCSVVLRFYCKAATEEKEPLRPTTARTVAVEMVRGYIDKLDINVQPPTRISRQRVKVEPTAKSADIASESLMERLSQLGL